jgi:hypothetical protein
MAVVVIDELEEIQINKKDHCCPVNSETVDYK